MPIQKSRTDILPKSGMDPRTVGGVKWVRNMKRWTATAPLEVRPGFGQRAQIDSTATISQDNSSNASGGYTKHLGSYIYNSNFGRRQVLSVFSVVCSHSSANSGDVTVNIGGTNYSHYQSIHGFTECVVFSIFDMTTKETHEELITFKTCESSTEDNIDKQFGHYETVATYNFDPIIAAPTKFHDYRSFKKGGDYVSFTQISDVVYFSSPQLGTWAYYGVSIPSRVTTARIDGDCPAPQRYAYEPYHSNNLHSGRSEGSVIKPVSGTRGINGRDVVYLKKAEIPASVGMAFIGGRAAYTSRNLVYFSDVNQPGAIMADNVASWSADGLATAIASFQEQLYVFTDQSIHTFFLRSQGVAGAPIPGVVDIISVETNHEAGCVSARSHCWTPYGICFVSTWGAHIIKDPKILNTLSDPVWDHWGEGLKDPLSSYNLNQGQSGEAGKEQAPMLFTHEGEPSLCYDVQSDSLMICYPGHILVYHFETKGWHIWPLGVRDNDRPGGGARAGSYFASFTGQSVVSDNKGLYLVSGLQDLDDSVSSNPYNENESYVIAELGLGGGPDRTIENEDYRCFGTGRYSVLMPTEAFATGPLPAPSLPGDGYTNNGWLLFIDPVDQWIARGGGTEEDTQYASYDVSLLVTEETLLLALGPKAAVSFKISVGGNWVFSTGSVGSHSQFGSRSGFTITTPSANQLAVVTPNVSSMPPSKVPVLRFTISNASSSTLYSLTDPKFTAIANESLDSAGATRSFPIYAFQASYRFPYSNNRWNAVSSTGKRVVGTHPSSGDPYSFNGATKHQRDVEWAVVTGDLGAGDGAIHRIRDIRSFVETGGQTDDPVTKFMGLYNTTVGSDYKMLSGQKQDYTDPYIADRDAMKKETIRNRMISGKRLFDSVAVWHNSASPSANDYLTDNPETNEIDVSTHAKGESIVAALFGRISSTGAYLRFHNIVALLQSYASNRRKGR